MTNLLPISQIVKATQIDKIHLAYLTKLRLIPQTIRRKVSDHIEGCYPDSVIPLIKRVEELKSRGLTYSQIKFHLEPQVISPAPVYQTPPSNSLAYLVIGLLLGYLLALTKPVTTNQSLAGTSNAPLDETSKTMVKMVARTSDSDQKIYLLAVPEQNLTRLGSVNINDLLITQ